MASSGQMVKIEQQKFIRLLPLMYDVILNIPNKKIPAIDLGKIHEW